MTETRGPDLPVDFRAEVVRPVMDCLLAGASCGLVGMGSVGKSNLLRFLQRADVQQAYLGDGWEQYLFIYVDANKLLKRSAWGLYELMLHQLLVALGERPAAAGLLDTLDDLHARATHPRTRRLALRYLDRGLVLAGGRSGFRLVFLLDEFDDLAFGMSRRGFAALRALRDDQKYRVMFVTATRMELHRLRENISEIEPFEELVSPHTIWIGPYSEADAYRMAARLGARFATTANPDHLPAWLAASGGHPGLLRAVFHALRAGEVEAPEALEVDTGIADECRRIWRSLPAEEQRAIVVLANDGGSRSISPEAQERLRRRGLLGGTWSGPEGLFSSLFAGFIRRDNPIVGAHIDIDPERRVAWVDGRKIEDLPPLGFNLLQILAQQRGRVFTIYELAERLYPEETAQEASNERIEAVVKRLRRAIEPNPDKPRFIVNVRGHGYKLEDGEIQKG